MKLKGILQLIFVFVLISTWGTYAQDNEEEMFYIADNYVESENFENSIKLYKRMLDEEPDNPTVNFKLGFCYLNTPKQKIKAIEHIDKSVKYFEKKKKRLKKRRTEYLESRFYLARAYQANSKFDIAIQKYKELKEIVTHPKLLSAIDKEIINTAKSKALLSESKFSKITNLGDLINSEYSDHSALVSADESVLIFTSRRPSKYNMIKDLEGEYDENIYVSYKNDDGTWTKPLSIGDNINTAEHEAVIGLSADGQQLLIYKSDDKGSIYLSTLKGDVWSKPKKLGHNINTRHRETHASISADGLTLYFTSDRNGGFGGLDIYCSRKEKDGTWGKAENLGKGINTDGDERSPYIHADGKTLYFSSKAHTGIGGLDIFFSKKNEFGTWTKPENLGYPINTTLDDVFYIGTADGKRSYYTSSRRGGFGKTDIYMIDLKDASFEPEITVMTGKVSICKGSLPEVSILIKEKETDKVAGIYTPNLKTGKFLFVLNRRTEYKVEFYTDEGLFYEETLLIKDASAYKQFHKVVRVPVADPCYEEEMEKEREEEKKKAELIHSQKDNVVEKYIDEDGVQYDSAIEIQNILFPSNSAHLEGKTKSLDEIAKYLIENPEAVIEIGAYADAKDMAWHNYRLTAKRAKSIRNYLLERKVNFRQMKIVAYGEENPISLNKNKDGTWNKLGQKYNRRIEFRIIKQGKTTVLVKPISNVPKYLINDKYDKRYHKNRFKHIEINY